MPAHGSFSAITIDSETRLGRGATSGGFGQNEKAGGEQR
ncbi:hypothetical protein BACCAP_00594 [Pseudoflavonifractor capillosus ATCC 29799]|uniref:Uncharacterized protein n=1 Tax=Pseudoflavonifractor capillosus ATCC 29799 TaxID=411467 RepID=A6NQX0_9FIRM|nr:hypothetical protein BACCAP_00594 [Pseudoflavonifractor capillosus ATCC 29799]